MSVRDNITRMKARDQLIAKKLESADIPEELKGKPLKLPQMNFKISLEKLVQSMYGPPWYALRARQVEDKVDGLMNKVAKEYKNMIDTLGMNAEIFAQQWKEYIGSLQLEELNDLIERHNIYYPVEANLSIDLKTEGFLVGSTAWEPKEKITTGGLLERFPPDIDIAITRGTI